MEVIRPFCKDSQRKEEEREKKRNTVNCERVGGQSSKIIAAEARTIQT